MNKLLACIKKEAVLLIRDKAGIGILFLMPTVLVIIMALVQDVPFRDFYEFKIPVLMIDNDKDSLSSQIEIGLEKSGIFEVSKTEESDLTKADTYLQQEVNEGNFLLGIYIKQNSTDLLRKNVNGIIGSIFSGDSVVSNDSIVFDIYIDPTTKRSFRNSLISSLREFSKDLELQYMLYAISQEMSELMPESRKQAFFKQNSVCFREKGLGRESGNFVLNSTQHNVPAWTMFAIFFIVVPLAGSIIKEREQGSYLRILTMPGSFFSFIFGKVTIYLLVCTIQFFLIFSIGYFLFPYLGLPKLIIGNNVPAIFITILVSGIAATGYGIAIGTLFSTHQQATTFGAASIFILAAIGGIWVPINIMPESLQFLSNFSPLSWGLDLFNSIFLRDSPFTKLLPNILKLLSFSATMFFIGYYKNRKKYLNL